MYFLSLHLATASCSAAMTNLHIQNEKCFDASYGHWLLIYLCPVSKAHAIQPVKCKKNQPMTTPLSFNVVYFTLFQSANITQKNPFGVLFSSQNLCSFSSSNNPNYLVSTTEMLLVLQRYQPLKFFPVLSFATYISETLPPWGNALSFPSWGKTFRLVLMCHWPNLNCFVKHKCTKWKCICFVGRWLFYVGKWVSWLHTHWCPASVFNKKHWA